MGKPAQETTLDGLDERSTAVATRSVIVATSIPAFHVSDPSKVEGRGDVFIASRVDAVSSGVFSTKVSVHFDPAVDDYPTGAVLIKADLSDSVRTTFTATSVELINSYGKHNPTVYLTGRWYRLELDPATIDRRDPIASLDVALLQDRVLGPILGIGDPRTDKRIDFVGGIRGPAELARRVDSGDAAIAFALYPTSLEQLMAVSDAGQVMPPKSTWFEPKLRSGLFVHELE